MAVRTSKRLVTRKGVPPHGRQRALKIQALDYNKSILMSEQIIWRQKDQWGNKPTWLSSWWRWSSQHQRTGGFVQCFHSMEKRWFYPASVWKHESLDRQREKPAASGVFITVLGKLEADCSGPAIGIIRLWIAPLPTFWCHCIPGDALTDFYCVPPVLMTSLCVAITYWRVPLDFIKVFQNVPSYSTFNN